MIMIIIIIINENKINHSINKLTIIIINNNNKKKTMCSNNKESLEIDWRHLSTIYPHLAVWVADCPTEMLEIFDEICFDVVLAQFPYYGNVCKYINARISNLTIRESLR